MTAMTTQSTMDIHNSVARLLAKPMLPNAAKANRIVRRRQNRASTALAPGCVGPSGRSARRRCSTSYRMCLAEIVAADRFIERVRKPPHRGDAGSAQRRADALCLDEGREDRKREVCMTCLDRLIEPVRQLAFARQRAIPFAPVIGNAADLPERQLQIDQREGHVGPGMC